MFFFFHYPFGFSWRTNELYDPARPNSRLSYYRIQSLFSGCVRVSLPDSVSYSFFFYLFIFPPLFLLFSHCARMESEQ